MGSHRHLSVVAVGYPARPLSLLRVISYRAAALPHWLGLWGCLMAPTVNSSGDGNVSAIPAPAEIRAQLERILNSATFHTSPQRRALLRYLVEETLAGRADGLKGYSLGLAVFGRGETFDSQSDPVVRLEARRLRRDLDIYYVDAGAQDPVRITIPKGHYVPHFDWHRCGQRRCPPMIEREAAGGTVVGATGQRQPPTRRMVPEWPGAAAWVSASWPACSPSRSSRSAGCGLWLRGPSMSVAEQARGPAIVVLPFETLSAGEDDRFLAAGVTQELITDLMRFEGFTLYSVPASFSLDAHADPMTLGHQPRRRLRGQG